MRRMFGAAVRVLGPLLLVFGAGFSSACELNPEFDENASGVDAAATLGTTGDATAVTTDAPSESSTGADPGVPLADPCPRLPAPEGNTVTVTPADAPSLGGLIASQPEGTTILFESGTYPIPDGLWISNPGVTLRSVSGNAEDVILDGQRTATSILSPVASNITIAELTLQRPAEHMVHTSGTGGVAALGVTAYGVRLIDPTRIAFKINPGGNDGPSDDGLFACSTIELTDAGRDELGAACPGVAGVAGFGAIGWTVRDNDISGLWCPTGRAGTAIAFVETSADTRVERNRVRDCASGIRFGVSDEPGGRREIDSPACPDGPYDHYGGYIRDNFVSVTGTGIASSEDGFDSGIGLWQVCDATVAHNTVASAIGSFAGIEFRFDKTTAKILNNLTTEEILVRDDAGAPVVGNLAGVDLNNFVDPLAGDLHLVAESEAVDAGVNLGEDGSPHDIDGEPRAGGLADVGADERPR